MLFNVFLSAATVAVAFAAPPLQNRDGTKVPTVKAASAKCGNGQVISCCNGGLALVGGNCSPIPLLSLLPISTACNNQVACCTGDQAGLVNLQCTLISL
ncbi:uncharacterized protein MAM_06072 [Metarhizium album ARSEF 1941]|uniref:Hydrophobin n=1 Tax=Metarhizium album (strain ARSEF 1941) TaxID=1081103 RepID=A0A0B2WR45_METAS|nr:uncharacterized protein MAM_06072 [Metarhizium album ARSEF 1941]KHN95967.1 Hydrophobin, fungi [Metarhizium album ARSEF 1941]